MFDFIRSRINTLLGISNGIKAVYVETVGACTNRCYCCPSRGGKAEQGKMSDETFKLIISKLKEINYNEELHIYGQCEPFLDKDILSKIYYAHEELPDAKIVLISNFTVLNDHIIDEILKAPIYNFSTSVYGLDFDTYKKTAGSGNFKLFFINLVKFLKKYAQINPYSFAVYIIHSEFMDHDIDFIRHFLFNIAPARLIQEGRIMSLFNTIFNKLKRTKKYFTPCNYTDLKITSDGEMVSCPCDAENLLRVGNITEDKTIYEIYNSKIAKNLRKKMLYSNSKDAYCQYCDSRRGGTLFDYLFPMFKTTKIVGSEKDQYNHKLRAQRNTAEEMQEKLVMFNQIFKDNEEDKWIEALEELRKDFYTKKQTVNI